MDDIAKNKFVQEFIEFLRKPSGHEYFMFSVEFNKLSVEERAAALLDIIILLTLFRELDEIDKRDTGRDGGL